MDLSVPNMGSIVEDCGTIILSVTPGAIFVPRLGPLLVAVGVRSALIGRT